MTDAEYLDELFDDLSKRKQKRYKSYSEMRESIADECVEMFRQQNVSDRMLEKPYLETVVRDTSGVVGKRVFDYFIKELRTKDEVITLLQDKFKKIMNSNFDGGAQ